MGNAQPYGLLALLKLVPGPSNASLPAAGNEAFHARRALSGKERASGETRMNLSTWPLRMVV